MSSSYFLRSFGGMSSAIVTDFYNAEFGWGTVAAWAGFGVTTITRSGSILSLIWSIAKVSVASVGVRGVTD